MSNEASAASCTNLYLHYDNSAAVDFEYVPAAFLAHFVLELDRRQSHLKQLYVPGILDTRNEKLCLLEDCPSATWKRITRIDRVRTLQPFLKRKIAELFDESLQELKFGVVYCNLLHDSWAADNQVLLPFLYRRQDVAWAQQYLGWPLEDMGHNMRSVVIAGHTQEDREKDILRHYNLTADSQAFRRVAVLSQKCSRCSGKPAEGQILLQCDRCRQAFYCNQNCQKQHWRQGHKSDCCPQPEWRDNATRSSLVAYHP